MTLTSLDEPVGWYLSFDKREENAILTSPDVEGCEIGRRLDRDPGVISVSYGGKPLLGVAGRLSGRGDAAESSVSCQASEYGQDGHQSTAS